MNNTTHFGFKDVETREKQGLVKDVFDSVASKYDLMNDVLSFGVHRLWKEYAIQQSNIQAEEKVLDIAGGTGDLSLKFKQKKAEVVLADINNAMLNVGRNNLINKGVGGIKFVQTDAEKLAFKDSSFDVVSIAFGLRNVTNKQAAINEFFRVLKPNGRLLILEFSTVEPKTLKKLYDLYSLNLMPKLGKIIVGDEASYQYLAESIRKHPNQKMLKNMVLRGGFKNCEYHNLSAGIVALHKAIKQ